MRSPIIRSGRVWVAVLVILVSPIFVGCETVDERELCCEEVVLEYRYVRTQFDEYKPFITHERHFLFDGGGLYLREVPAHPTNRQRIVMRGLPEGSYTMLTIGNMSEGYTALSGLEAGVSRLSEVRLALEQQIPSGDAFSNAEELFWNFRRFRSERGQRHHYLCDMSNIHCHLYLRVEWEGVPPNGSRQFSVELSQLTPAYTLRVVDEHTLHVAGRLPKGWNRDEPASGYVVHHFPYSELPPSGVVRVDEELRGQELYAEVRSLRYLDDRIPTLQLLHEGNRLFNKPIDLTPMFHDWGWFPNQHHEQIYRIHLRILRDGHVEVRPWLLTNVLDWEDGGSFG